MRLPTLGFKEIGRDHRRDHPRDGQTHQHRSDDGETEALEELPRDTRHQRDRQEHRDDGHRRRDHRETDFVGGLDRCLIGRFTHPHMAHDILDLDDRIVDQHARDEAEREQAQTVQRKAHQVHEPEGRDRRKRNRDRRNDRRSPVAQEEKDDYDGKHGAFDHRFDRAVILRSRIIDAGAERAKLHAGILCFKLVKFGDGFVVDGNVGRSLGALHAENNDLLAIDLGDRALFAKTVRYIGDVLQRDGAAVAKADPRLRQRQRGVGIAQHANRLARSRYLGLAAGSVKIDRTQCVIDLRCCHAERLHACGIEDDAYLAVDAAAATDISHAFDAQQALRHGIVDKPRQLLERHVRRLDRIIADWLAGDLDLRYPRFKNPVGKLAARLVDRVLNLGKRVVNVNAGADLELDENARASFRRCRIDLIDAIDRSHRGFDPLGDLRLDFGRGGPRLDDRDLDRGKIDIGVVVDVEPRETDQPGEQQSRENYQRHHRVANRPGRDVAKVHGNCPLVVIVIRPGVSRLAPAPGD